MPMSLYTQEHTLHVYSKPNHGFYSELLLITGLTLVGFAVLLFFRWIEVAWIILTTSLLVVGLYVLVTRTSRCVFSLTDNSIVFEEGGILNSSLGQAVQKYDLANLEAIQVSRTRTEDTESFSIQLRLKHTKQSPLVGSELNAEDCQHYSSRIQQFVGSHVPIVTVG